MGFLNTSDFKIAFSNSLASVFFYRLVEMTLLRRHGYAFRMEYEQFLNRYKMLSLHTWSVAATLINVCVNSIEIVIYT